MMTPAQELDRIMEAASTALARMDYLQCEAHCIEALALARRADNWSYIARIFLPLQEARRQRRMIAADGTIRLGTASLHEDLDAWFSHLAGADLAQALAGGGCILITTPHTPEAAGELTRRVRRERKYVEVLFADPAANIPAAPSDSPWRVHSFAGPEVFIDVTPPPPAWQDQWLTPGDMTAPNEHGLTPGSWFLQVADALCDAAIRQASQNAQATQEPGDDPISRFDRLYACLEVFKDHEILHQRLADAAREIATATP